MTEADVVFENPGVDIERVFTAKFLSQTAIEILWFLLENKEVNSYSISKKLKMNNSTVYRAITEQLIENSVGLLEVSRRKNYKKKSEETEIYSLSQRGYRVLANSLYGKYSTDENECIQKLNELFNNIRQNYPSFIPELYRKLPFQYSVCFYPYFINDFSSFLKLIEVKCREPEKSEFVVDNSFFKFTLPLTLEQEKIILEYTKKIAEEQEVTHKQELKETRKNLKLLNDRLLELSS